jgi:hypothetical protein
MLEEEELPEQFLTITSEVRDIDPAITVSEHSVHGEYRHFHQRICDLAGLTRIFQRAELADEHSNGIIHGILASSRESIDIAPYLERTRVKSP